MISETKKYLARIKRGEKLVGQDAIAAAHLNLGELYRSEGGEFCLSTTRSLGIKTPACVSNKRQQKNITGRN